MTDFKDVTDAEADAYALGRADGAEQGESFSCGRTWTPEDTAHFAELNEAYDRGVNDGQRSVGVVEKQTANWDNLA